MAGGWLSGATREQWRALAAACLGWMLDSMDVMLFALVLPAMMRDLHLTASVSGAIMSATLVSAAAGGLVFGWLADRWGRKNALLWSVLIYSVATAACGFARTAAMLAVFRIVLGLGMGGEWASGAALVAETWPAWKRSKVLAFVQSFWAVGYALGALLVAVVMPRFGWRAVFFAGILPAVVALWIRTSVQEPNAWKQEHSGNVSPMPLFRAPLRRSTVVCATMNAASLFAWWGLFTWVPRFLSLPVAQGGRGLSVVQTSSWTIVMQVGTFLGYLTFGYVADWVGRKQAYIGYLLLAAAAVPLYATVSARWLLLVGPAVGFFGTGYFSGFSVITSELFPTRLRASAMGFAYNIGRLASAAAPYVIGRASEHAGLGASLLITSVGFVVAAAIALALPHTASMKAPVSPQTAKSSV